MDSLSNFIYFPGNGFSKFPEGYFCLGKAQKNFTKNSIVLIKYPDKNQKKDTIKPEMFFYPLLDKDTNPPKISEKDYAQNAGIIFESHTPLQQYLQKVNALKKHIQAGDIYEINFCIEFFAENVEIDPVQVFYRLNELSSAPYACLAKLDDEYIISASPELFLQKNNRHLITKPIKGTAPRSSDEIKDELHKLQLKQSEKERTENVMIVDVARNDLSVLASKGSVNVDKLFDVESFKTVHQLVSTVSCELKKDFSFNEIINATFPMPSMTGAPKIRAMELIDEFEDFSRNSYSGSIGFMDGDENFTLSVVIRSIFYNVHTKRVSFSVGSAITHLCDPEKEYEECLLKARALLEALNGKLG